MALENLADSFYQLWISENVENTAQTSDFNKLKHLQKCEPPISDPVLDDVTATDDRHTVKVKVDFTEDSEIEFEYTLDETDPQHILLQKAFDDGTPLNFRFIFVEAASLSRQFTGNVTKLKPNPDDKKKKLRMSGTITITNVPTKFTP